CARDPYSSGWSSFWYLDLW
nr:immunoglobulin heavy chain junction region [Macaca mulatta]